MKHADKLNQKLLAFVRNGKLLHYFPFFRLFSRKVVEMNQDLFSFQFGVSAVKIIYCFK